MSTILHPELKAFLVSECSLAHYTENTYIETLKGVNLAIVLKVATHPNQGGKTLYSAAFELVTGPHISHPLVHTRPISIEPDVPCTRDAWYRHWKTTIRQQMRRLHEIAKYIPRCNCGPRAFKSVSGSFTWVCLRQYCPSLREEKDIHLEYPPNIKKMLMCHSSHGNRQIFRQ